MQIQSVRLQHFVTLRLKGRASQAKAGLFFVNFSSTVGPSSVSLSTHPPREQRHEPQRTSKRRPARRGAVVESMGFIQPLQLQLQQRQPRNQQGKAAHA
jgi:hypothetical protein